MKQRDLRCSNNAEGIQWLLVTQGQTNIVKVAVKNLHFYRGDQSQLASLVPESLLQI